MFEILLRKFIIFFSVIDPIGTIPVFIAVTAGYNAQLQKKIALKAALVAGSVLLLFIIAGEFVLDGMDVPLYSFQIAGGIVLFLFALTMIFGESKPSREIDKVDKKDDIAIFPLAMPSLASPGAIMAAILLTENRQNDVIQQGYTALMMLLVVLIAWIFMRLASKIYRVIGDSGAAIISRVMGLILCSVAVENVLVGITTYLSV